MFDKFMIVNTETGEREEILGKYMYYSLPKLIVEGDKVKEICEKIGFPISVNENISPIDAFRSATSEIRDRIEEKVCGEKRVCRIYCRDNKRVQAGLISRELVEETLYETTNEYRKLANFTLDRDSEVMVLSDVDTSSSRDIYGYFERARSLYELYCRCIGNRSISTMADKYITGLHAISISARGHHYFVPKKYMHGIELLEEFMELIASENLSTYSDHRNAKYISMNSMYVADDAKQRKKMSYEFYQDMGQQIAEYQQNITRLIQNGNTSQKILDRWMLKIQALESKKKEYEQVLKQNLSGIDEEFTMLRDICDQFGACVRSSQIFSVAA